MDSPATTWSHYAFPPWSGLGVLVWASFALDPAEVPHLPRSFVFLG